MLFRSHHPEPDPIRKAYHAKEAADRVGNTRVGAALVVTLMPAGSTLDYFVYPEHLGSFFWQRILCSALAGAIWMLLRHPFGKRAIIPLGMIVPLLPAAFIAVMIAQTEGFASPYYAGLNLVLLAVGAVLHWTLVESVVGVLIALGLYVAAGLWHAFTHSFPPPGTVFNNFYFISLMDVIVVVGTFFQSRARFREFCLRYELDVNRNQLEESNRKLQELDQAKSRFFANISHELRTPLTLLLAPLETLLNRHRGRLDGETVELVQTMHSNGMRLLKLINDLLDIVRLESGRLEVRRETLNLPEFVRGIISAARQMADDKRIQLTTSITPELTQVQVDRDKLEKTLLNLVFNALKFTPAGGRVEIHARREKEELVIAVSDTGVGISQKNLANVFSRFWQADDSSRRKYQGVGIGLSLVKEFTELQGGTVSVDSEEGKGTTFTLRLPYLEAGAPAPEQATTAPVGAKAETLPAAVTVADTGTTVTSQEWLSSLYRRAELFPAMTAVRDSIKPVETTLNSHLPKVLIADDEPDMLRFIKSQLKEHYQIIEAVDGNQAVQKATQFLPDLVLTDMMMPEKDGLQVCRELRSKAATQAIPVVLITARADEETKLAALAAGASDFLPKPFSTTELHIRVKNLVENFEYQRRLSKQNQVLERTIEQLQETEIQLVQTEKLASLGRLSAGIIHEINNPLNFASTGLFTLKKKAKHFTGADQEDYKDVLRDVEEGLQRIKGIVSDLRSFSHQDHEQLDTIVVADAIASTLRFLSHEWKSRVRIETDIPRSAQVCANKNKLIQVLINLVQNAIDATTKAPVRPGEQPTVKLIATEEAGRVLIRVQDNGIGIPEENLGKIFDPFFTTKDVGQGMGLGLSICYRIIQQFGGAITVHSRPGELTEFVVELPAGHAGSASIPASKDSTHATAL